MILRVAATGIAWIAVAGPLSAAEVPPHPPCGDGDPIPTYAAAGSESPASHSWKPLEWSPPPCLHWTETRYRFVIALAGRLEGVDAGSLQARLGAISTTRGLRYWSVTEGAWRVLIKDAAALAGPGGPRRADFSPEELRPGAILYFVEEDNRSASPVTYALQVHEAGADRIVVTTENVTPIKAMLVTLFPPGTLRAAYIMTRMGARSWGLYALSAANEGAGGFASMGEASYANRARALFEHLAPRTPR